MAQFLPAFQYLMQFEDPEQTFAETADNRGQVISGVNSLAWPQDFAIIAALPQSERAPAVSNFYLSKFWNPMLAGGIDSQDVANRYVDCGVNCGARPATEMLQKAVNALHAATVAEDGVIGPLTLEAVNATDPDAILAAFRSQRAAYYEAIVAANPADQPYLNGWLRRAQN
jgi:lysozyme family protein